jgi:hypothetical protein
MKARLIALAVVVCAGLVLASAATAGAPYATQVTIKEQNGDFNGKVKSENSICIADRTVTVFKRRKGRPDKKINSDTSGKDGKWSTGNTHVGKGKYYAKAKPVLKGSGCKRGKSRVVTVD